MSWTSINGTINDPASFVFVLQNHKGIPAHKFNKTGSAGIWDAVNLGPSFGRM